MWKKEVLCHRVLRTLNNYSKVVIDTQPHTYHITILAKKIKVLQSIDHCQLDFFCHVKIEFT